MKTVIRLLLVGVALAAGFVFYIGSDWVPEMVLNRTGNKLGRKPSHNEKPSPHLDDNSTITMLVWTKWWWHVHEGLLTECPRPNCYLTTKRALLNQSQAVVFHSRTIDWNDLPSPRFSNQSYIFSNFEPPYRTGGNFSEPWMRMYFNMTMTYRRDSDVHMPYGEIVKRRTPLRYNLEELVANKTKPIAWMVGNCNTPGGREVLVEHLQKHIPVDIFGACGKLKCDRDNDEYSNPSTCGSVFEQNYKFYLSFENHMCIDYVSEKFFQRLRRYLVPIVLERRNFAHFIPEYIRHWFIAVDDFANVAMLGEYLKYLHGNASAYYEYLEWHEHYETVIRLNSDTGKLTNDHWCKLCEKVAETEDGTRRPRDVMEWWKKDACDTSNKLFHDYIWTCKLC